MSGSRVITDWAIGLVSRSIYLDPKGVVWAVRAVSDTRSGVALNDTSAKAREVYFRRLKQMSCSERLALGVALWQAGDSLQRAAMRHKSPLADETEITFQIAVSRFGSEIAHKVYAKR